jgi:potassium-transporting ATPase KdpC subunit
MKNQIRSTVISILILTVILGIIYPFLVCGIGTLFFPHHAKGALVRNEHKQIIGSKFIGQNFTSPKYFHPRPSYAGDGYDAMASGASNLAPTSKALLDIVQERILAYKDENSISPSEQLPVDAVTASGSGLDPHISLKNAMYQAPRIANARNISIDRINDLINKMTIGRFLGLFGEPHVNVLMLNLKLDQELYKE